jgi:GTP-binding protein Era
MGEHCAGYISILGKPNAGKSTLLNALVGENLSIVTPKVQTTRHRILGIRNEEDSQMVFSDTPGILQPAYLLQESMMKSVYSSLEDADVLLLITSIEEENWEEEPFLEILKNSDIPKAVILNKIDLSDEGLVNQKMDHWKSILNPKTVIPISAVKGFNIDSILSFVSEQLPIHPPYFEKDELSDRHVRFFMSEIIREKIMQFCQKEVPYSSEVVITTYTEGADIDRIYAEIIVERESQKVILIGKGGEMIKRIGTEARLKMEDFLKKRVFVDIRVKVIDGWRSKQAYLKRFGYE